MKTIIVSLSLKLFFLFILMECFHVYLVGLCQNLLWCSYHFKKQSTIVIIILLITMMLKSASFFKTLKQVIRYFQSLVFYYNAKFRYLMFKMQFWVEFRERRTLSFITKQMFTIQYSSYFLEMCLFLSMTYLHALTYCYNVNMLLKNSGKTSRRPAVEYGIKQAADLYRYCISSSKYL